MAPLGFARADQVWTSSMNRMICPCGLGDFLEHGLEAFLEFAAVFRAGDKRAEVELQ